MQLLNKISLCSLLAFSAASMAETYTVSVEMNSSIGETPLVAEQTQAMSYPVLEVNEATQEGSMCVASGQVNSTGFNGQTATNANSLCPGATGNGSIVQFTGVPNAIVTVERSIVSQELNGVRFAHYDGNPWQNVSNLTLNGSDGIGITGLWSSVTLFDKSQATDSVMEFNYQISAAYQ